MRQLSSNTEMEHLVKKENSKNNVQFMLTANINIDAKTKYLHCEKDTTYTTIYVPKQISTQAFIVFEFELNELHSLKIKFPPESCFTYSAYCLGHRQIYTNGHKCMNVSTYSSKRLYCHFRKSMVRLSDTS